MEKYHLTAEEWLVTQLLFLSGAEERKQQDYFNRFAVLPLDQRKSTTGTILSLQEKGIISKSYKLPKKGETFDPEEIIFNKNFMKDYFMYSGIMGEEMLQAYPIYVERFQMNNFTKKFNSREDLFFAYGKAVKFNPEKHAHAMEMLKWGKENNLVRYNICEYVIARKWEELEKLKRDGFEGERCIIEAI